MHASCELGEEHDKQNSLTSAWWRRTFVGVGQTCAGSTRTRIGGAGSRPVCDAAWHYLVMMQTDWRSWLARWQGRLIMDDGPRRGCKFLFQWQFWTPNPWCPENEPGCVAAINNCHVVTWRCGGDDDSAENDADDDREHIDDQGDEGDDAEKTFANGGGGGTDASAKEDLYRCRASRVKIHNKSLPRG